MVDKIFWVLFFGLIWQSVGFAQNSVLNEGDYRCYISIKVIENYNNEPNVEKLFNEIFGGYNTIKILKSENGIKSAQIFNQNGADDLQSLVMWNYTTETWEFVSASLVGPVRGTLKKCELKN